MLLWQPIQQLFQSTKKLGSHRQFNPAKTLIHKWRTDLPLKRKRKSHIPGLKHLLITKNITIDRLRRHSFLFLLSSLSGEAVIHNTRGNMRPVHQKFTSLENFCVLLAQLVLAHNHQLFDDVELSKESAMCTRFCKSYLFFNFMLYIWYISFVLWLQPRR